MKISSKKGFTLIELLVVIAIISLLSSVVLASLNTARSKARDAKRLAEIRQLQTALEFFYNDYGVYPSSVGGAGCGATIPNAGWCNSVQSLSGGRWIRDLGTMNVLAPYISSDPVDPSSGASANWLPVNGGTIFYDSAGGGNQWYMLVFGLENPNLALEAQDGVTRCDPIVEYDYGLADGSDGVLTFGVGC
jgi:prepilin-type N-terminal cleavage/methylation domain-containing protein